MWTDKHSCQFTLMIERSAQNLVKPKNQCASWTRSYCDHAASLDSPVVGGCHGKPITKKPINCFWCHLDPISRLQNIEWNAFTPPFTPQQSEIPDPFSGFGHQVWTKILHAAAPAESFEIPWRRLVPVFPYPISPFTFKGKTTRITFTRKTAAAAWNQVHQASENKSRVL